MEPGLKRTTIARIFAVLAFLCGAIGLLSGMTKFIWIMSPLDWFAGGALLSLVALYVLVDGAVSFEKSHGVMAAKH
jgi:hypothetical protein